MYKFIILSIFALIAAPASAFSPSMARNSVATVSSTTRVFAVSEMNHLIITQYELENIYLESNAFLTEPNRIDFII